MKSLICVVAFAAGFAASACAAEANANKPQLTPEERVKRTQMLKMKRFGGYIDKRQPDSAKFVFVDAQKRVQALAYTNQYEIISDVFAVELKHSVLDAQVGIENAVDTIKKSGGGAGVIFVDRPDYPTLLIAPESGYGIVNVGALAADNPGAALLEKRFRRELWRAFAMTAGSPNTEWPHCLLNSIGSLKDLDLIDSEAVSPEPQTKITKHLAKFGIKPFKRVTYKQACQEGWAPLPQNEFQKKIWDKVHEIPTNPLQIKFDPKTDSGK